MYIGTLDARKHNHNVICSILSASKIFLGLLELVPAWLRYFSEEEWADTGLNGPERRRAEKVSTRAQVAHLNHRSTTNINHHHSGFRTLAIQTYSQSEFA